MTRLQRVGLRSLFVAQLAVGLAIMTTSVAHATKYWRNGVVSGNWGVGTNWSSISASDTTTSGVPATGEDVNIVHTDGTARTVTLNVNAPSGQLGSLGLLSIDLTGAGTMRNVVSMPNSNSFTADAITVGGHNGVAVTNGRAIVNQSNGTTTISAAPGGHLTLAWGSGSNGTYTLTGGALVSNNSEWVGYGGDGTFNHAGGTNTINGAANHLYVGCCAGGNGDYTISGTSSLTVGGSAFIGTFGTATLNIHGQSSVHINGSLDIGNSSRVNVNGGTLRFQTHPGGAGGVSRINYAAGTIRLGGNRDIGVDNTIATLFPGSVVTERTVPAGKGLEIEGNANIFPISVGTTLKVSGGRFVTQGNLNVGIDSSDNSSINVINGGTAITNGNCFFNGNAAGDSVSGAGSSWTIDGNMIFNANSSSLLTIEDQGFVSIGNVLDKITAGPGVRIHLNGGTLRLNTYGPNVVTDTVNYVAGTIQLAGNRNIGTDEIVLLEYGNLPSIPTGKTLAVEGTAILDASSAPMSLAGGTLSAQSVAILSGGRLVTTQSSQVLGATVMQPSSVIDATGGDFVVGDATKVNGFYGNGTLQVGQRTVTLADANEAVFDLAALVELGSGASPGTVDAANGLTLDFGGNATGFGTISTPNNIAKPLINNGHITGASAAQRITLPGYVKGVGTFDNVNITGTFSPGLSPTILSVGNITFSPTSTLIMELGGTTPGSGYDQLQSAGAIVLDGTLQISLINGFVPAAGQTFDLFNSATLSGSFSSIVLPSIPGMTWDTSQLASGMLSAVPGLPGDFNNNGTVDAADYVMWRKTGSPPADYTTWRTNFGRSTGSGASTTAEASVPEPMSAVSMYLCVVLCVVTHRMVAVRLR